MNRPERNLPCINGYNETAAARSLHPGGVHVAMADASARFISEDISLRTWRAMGTIKGEEIYDLD